MPWNLRATAAPLGIAGRPLIRTGTAWRRWAAKLATEATRRDGCTWAAVVAWIEHRNAYRITLAGQPER